MTSKLKPVRHGVRQALEGIPGLRVTDYRPDTWNDFPLAVVEYGHLRVNVTLCRDRCYRRDHGHAHDQWGQPV